MKFIRLAVASAVAATLCCPVVAGPLDQIKGKMKEGLYEYKMTMDMGQVPGMPAGMGPQTMTMQNCLKSEDIEKGAQLLGLTLDEHISHVITGMQRIAVELGLAG